MFRIARATVHSASGWLAYKLGWHGTARRQFERVLLLRGADFRAYVHLGRIAFDHGDYAGWRREFEHARRTDPIRFARLRHPIELFEPRLAGTQFEGSTELDSFQAADSRATWRALHPFGADAPGHAARGDDGQDGRMPDGFGRGTDLPLAPGYDPMIPGQPFDDDCDGAQDRKHGAPSDRDADELGPTPFGADAFDSLDSDAFDRDAFDADSVQGDAFNGDPLAADPLNQDEARRRGNPDLSKGGDRRSSNGWNMPDASLSRDDFSSPIERRRFQLRRPIDRQEIARCDLNELARRLSS